MKDCSLCYKHEKQIALQRSYWWSGGSFFSWQQMFQHIKDILISLKGKTSGSSKTGYRNRKDLNKGFLLYVTSTEQKEEHPNNFKNRAQKSIHKRKFRFKEL